MSTTGPEARLDPDSVFVLTTENDRGRRFRRVIAFVFILAGLLLLVLPAGVYVMEQRSDATSRSGTWHVTLVLVLSAGASALSFVTAARVLSTYRRGTWTLTAQGIEYTPLRGERRFLSWSAVQAVADFFRGEIEFRGGDISICILLTYEDSGKAELIRNALAFWLGSQFDFSRRATDIGLVAKLFCVLLVVGAVLGLPLVILLYRLGANGTPYAELAHKSVAALLIVSFLGVHIGAIVHHLRTARWRHRQFTKDEET